ncbi:MAG: BrnT family toxin [Desulfurellaceae bacterium]|nr:BrnT family toxin [Desulfurellaceae bacterium]
MAKSERTLSAFFSLVAIYAQYTYIEVVKVVFDPKKNATNIRQHGVSLADGDGVLNDPLALTIEDDVAEGEQRFVSMGANFFGTLMVVVYTYRNDEVRLISVRKAEPKERRVYEKGI